MPGPNVHNQRRTSSAQASASGRGTGALPSHACAVVQTGREMRQWPAFRPRNSRPRAPSTVRIRGATGASCAHLPLPNVILAPSAGTCARRVAASSAPSGSRWASTSAAAASTQAAPSSATPDRSTSAASRRSSVAATRADAPPSAAGSRSRVKPNSVRRMASCLTTERSELSRSSTAPVLSPSTLACRERYTVAGSVACRTVIARVAATASG